MVMVNEEKFVSTNTNSMTFELDSNGDQIIRMIFFSLHVTSFPHDNLKSGKFPHEEYCKSESKTITNQVVILNHPFFFDCFQEHLPLNSVLAVHLKSGDIVTAIIRSFKNGDQSNSLNNTHLSPTA